MTVSPKNAICRDFGGDQTSRSLRGRPENALSRGRV